MTEKCGVCGQDKVYDPEDDMMVCPDALMSPNVECEGRSWPLLTAVIPAYNEEGCIREFSARLHAQLQALTKGCWEAIYMVGGSDRTAEILLKDWRDDARVRIIYQRERGLGTAINTGFKCVRSDSLYVLTMDADLQQLPEEIHLLWARRGTADLLVGSKGLSDSRGLIRRITTRSFYWLYGMVRLQDLFVQDLGSNFRLYTKEATQFIHDAPNPPPGYSFMQWSIRTLVSGRFTAAEVQTSFLRRTTGESKLSFRREIRERLRLP